ncbi:lipoyl synthase, partial [bacterium]|nr:lipoyl synthase [bacterium]
PWFKVPLGSGEQYQAVRRVLAAQGLNTVCSSVRCPNLGECWSSGTATFMILGDICTRNCGFCAVSGGEPLQVDTNEPQRVCGAVRQLGLKYVVITSVTRDDLVDGGASVFAAVIQELKEHVGDVRVEVLIPDFLGKEDALKTVLAAEPDVLNHNVETVPDLYYKFRPQADYRRSLILLKRTSQKIGEKRTKSGLMVGVGETRNQLHDLLQDLRLSGVGRLTVGQYLQPTRNHFSVERYVSPDEFKEIAVEAKSLGFSHVASGPLVRSSYHAADM